MYKKNKAEAGVASTFGVREVGGSKKVVKGRLPKSSLKDAIYNEVTHTQCGLWGTLILSSAQCVETS